MNLANYQEKGNQKDRSAFILDVIATLLVGMLCFGYTPYVPFYFGPAFSELHIQLPFLNFPIFIGEITLAILLCLLAIKLLIKRIKFRFFHGIIAFFIVFILVKSLIGYVKFGPMAFRNAAMFYYFLFSVITFHCFNPKFFENKKIKVLLISILFLIWLSGTIGNFSGFTYFSLILILSLSIKNKFIKIPGLLFSLYFLSTLLSGTGSKGFFFSCWLGFLLIIFCFIYILLTKYRVKKVHFAGGIIFFITLILIFLFNIDEHMKKRLKIWGNITNLVQEYNQQLNYIAPYETVHDIPYRGKYYNYLWPKYVKPRLYEAEGLTKETLEAPIPVKRAAKSTEDNNVKLKEPIEKIINMKTGQNNPEILNKDLDIIANNIYLMEKELLTLASLANNQEDKRKEVKSKIKSIRKAVKSLQQESGNSSVSSDKINLVVKSSVDLCRSVVKNSNQTERPKVDYRAPQDDINSTLWRMFLWRDIFNELKENKAVLGVSFGKLLRSSTMEKLRYLTGVGWSLGDWLGWVDPHNSYIHIIYRAGIVGVFFIAIVWLIFIKTFLSFLKSKSYIGVILSAPLFCYLVLANFIVFLELPRLAIPFWCLLGFVCGYSNYLKNRLIFDKESR